MKSCDCVRYYFITSKVEERKENRYTELHQIKNYTLKYTLKNIKIQPTH